MGCLWRAGKWLAVGFVVFVGLFAIFAPPGRKLTPAEQSQHEEQLAKSSRASAEQVAAIRADGEKREAAANLAAAKVAEAAAQKLKDSVAGVTLRLAAVKRVGNQYRYFFSIRNDGPGVFDHPLKINLVAGSIWHHADATFDFDKEPLEFVKFKTFMLTTDAPVRSANRDGVKRWSASVKGFGEIAAGEVPFDVVEALP